MGISSWVGGMRAVLLARCLEGSVWGYAGSVGEGARDGLGDPSCSLVAQAVGGRVAGYKKEQLTAQDGQTADESVGIAKLRAEYRQPCRDNEFLEQRTLSS